MVVELVCVGTELLLGNIVNTNAAFWPDSVPCLDYPCIISLWSEIMKSD